MQCAGYYLVKNKIKAIQDIYTIEMNVHESHALMLYILTKQKIEENITTLR